MQNNLRNVRTRIRNRIRALVLAGLAFSPALAMAQTILPYPAPISGARAVSQGYGTVSTDVGALVMYIGPQACGKVAVAAGGDITFTSGVCGAEVADTTLECPVSAPLGGVFTVANAACDTVGEIADLVNASTSWRFVPINMLRSDSSNDTFITLSATDATTAKGLKLLKDTTVALNMSVSPGSPDDDIRFYFQRGTTLNTTSPATAPAGNWVNNPWRNTIFRPLEIVDKVTTTGAATFSLLCIKETLSGNSFPNSQPTPTEVVRTVWTEAGGATTVQHTKMFPFFECDEGERPMFRLAATTTLTVGTISATAIRRDGVTR